VDEDSYALKSVLNDVINHTGYIMTKKGIWHHPEKVIPLRVVRNIQCRPFYFSYEIPAFKGEKGQ